MESPPVISCCSGKWLESGAGHGGGSALGYVQRAGWKSHWVTRYISYRILVLTWTILLSVPLFAIRIDCVFLINSGFFIWFRIRIEHISMGRKAIPVAAWRFAFLPVGNCSSSSSSSSAESGMFSLLACFFFDVR